MKHFFSFITVLLLSVLSFAQEHTIQGVVIDQRDYESLPFEHVSLHLTESNDSTGLMTVFPAVTVQTNIDGFFTFSNVKPGTYLIKVKSWGLNPYEGNVTVTEATGITELRIELNNRNPMSTYLPEED